MNKRLRVINYIIIILFFLLVVRAVQLQIVNGDYYYQLSEGNRISRRPINAPRGKIIDADENILVSNKLSYNLYLLPNEMSPDSTPEYLIQKLVDLTELKYGKICESYENNSKQNGSSAILLKRNITPETMVIIGENSSELSGLLVKESSMRDYVYGEVASHILGYVGEIGVKDLKEFREMGYDYDGNDIIGVTGLEREYEFYLKGIDGIEQIEVNNLGQKVRILGNKAPEPGNNIILNIDLDLQIKIEKILEEQFEYLRDKAENDPELDKPTGAAAIVMEVNTGKILAMSSIPNYNLNDFAGEFSNNSYQELINNPLKPLLNRAIMVSVPPGSIFKLVTGTAAIEELNVRADTEFVDKNGKFYIPNWSRPFKNWHEGGEGKLDFTKAIARSNNVIFYKLGYRLYEKYRGEKIIEYAKKYNLGKKTGIDLPGEKSGLVPDREWKMEKFNEGWYPGDSVNLAIGQGGLLTTSIQLVGMVSAIANEGIIYRPYIVDKVINSEGEIILANKPVTNSYLTFSKDVYRILREGMTEVTSSNYGTARSVFKDFPVSVAGKTGTAQTSISNSNHGWFVGYAPIAAPQISVLVFIENGYSSAYTLPVAGKIIKEYFGLSEDEEDKATSQIFKENYYYTKNRLFRFFKQVFLGEN